MNPQTTHLSIDLNVDETLIAGLQKLLERASDTLTLDELCAVADVQLRAARSIKEARRSVRALASFKA